MAMRKYDSPQNMIPPRSEERSGVEVAAGSANIRVLLQGHQIINVMRNVQECVGYIICEYCFEETKIHYFPSSTTKASLPG